jgi:maltose O-acetyltransferase
MVSGAVYQDSHPEIERKRAEAKRLFRAYDALGYDQEDERRVVARRLFGSLGEDVFIEPNFRCEFGHNISMGSHVYINFDGVMLDNAPITIGDHVWIAPMVGLFATNHALDFAERAAGAGRCAPIVIEDGTWLGGGGRQPGAGDAGHRRGASSRVRGKDHAPDMGLSEKPDGSISVARNLGGRRGDRGIG